MGNPVEKPQRKFLLLGILIVGNMNFSPKCTKMIKTILDSFRGIRSDQYMDTIELTEFNTRFGVSRPTF